MILKKIEVYHVFWIVAILILLIGIFDSDNTLDINIHDTYFVIANLHVAIALFLFYFLNGLGYWSIQKMLKRQLIKPLTIIHTLILIGSFIFYWSVIFYKKVFISNNSFPLFDEYLWVNMALAISFFLITFIAMPVLIVNLLIGLLRKVK